MMIVNENAKLGLFLNAPNELILDKEPDYTSKIDQRWLRRLIKNDALISFYSTNHWRKVRELVRARDHNECQRCAFNKRLTISEKSRDLHVHHIAEIEKFPQYALNMNNLITVCHNCHNIIHDRWQVEIKMDKHENFDDREWIG